MVTLQTINNRATMQRGFMLMLAMLLVPVLVLSAISPAFAANGGGGGTTTGTTSTSVTARTYLSSISMTSVGQLAVDANDNLYATDYNTVKKFDKNGTLIATWNEQLLFYPTSIAIGPDGNVYVADSTNVKVFDTNGTMLWQFGTFGTGNGQFGGYLFGLDFDSQGNIYVVDNNYDSNIFRVEKFDSEGNYLMQWGTDGTADGQFSYPSAITIDNNDTIYVADYTCRIQKFDTNGTYQGQFGSCGTGNGQFAYADAWGMTTDVSNNLYFADGGNNRVQKFDPNGTYLEQWGTYGSGNGQFKTPTSVAIDSKNNIYIADFLNHRIQKFGLPQNLGSVPVTYNGGTLDSYVTLAETNNITSITSMPAASYDQAYPLGLVDFTFNTATVGATETIQVFFETTYAASDVVAYKYDTTTQTSTAIPGATITATTQNGKTGLLVTYDVTDGGALDQDGIANGSITDPVGLTYANMNGTGSGSTGGTDGTGTATASTGLANTGAPVYILAAVATAVVAGGLVTYRLVRKKA